MTFLNERKPPLDELAHVGVKGMRWGHHKKEEPAVGRQRSKKAVKSTADAKNSANENALAKKYMAIPEKKRSKAEAEKALAENHKKFLNKFAPNDGSTEKKGLSDKQKALLKLGIGAAVIGGVMAYSAYSHNKNIKQMTDMAGKAIHLEEYKKNVGQSMFKTWSLSGYIQESSFARQEFTLPAGHTFHRLSTAAESTFAPVKPGTYSTHSIEDFNRYLAVFRHEKAADSLHHISWTVKEDIKVPTLATTLETLREHLSREQGSEVSHEMAKTVYQEWSGNGWDLNTHKTFFKSLTEKGYGAIVDEMDAGVIGETPLVFFAHHLASEKSAKLVTPEAIKQAESSLIEITNRKM